MQGGRQCGEREAGGEPEPAACRRRRRRRPRTRPRRRPVSTSNPAARRGARSPAGRRRSRGSAGRRAPSASGAPSPLDGARAAQQRGDHGEDAGQRAHRTRSPARRATSSRDTPARNHATMPSGIGPRLPIPQPPRRRGRGPEDVARDAVEVGLRDLPLVVDGHEVWPDAQRLADLRGVGLLQRRSDPARHDPSAPDDLVAARAVVGEELPAAREVAAPRADDAGSPGPARARRRRPRGRGSRGRRRPARRAPAPAAARTAASARSAGRSPPTRRRRPAGSGPCPGTPRASSPWQDAQPAAKSERPRATSPPRAGRTPCSAPGRAARTTAARRPPRRAAPGPRATGPRARPPRALTAPPPGVAAGAPRRVWRRRRRPGAPGA